MQSLGAVLGVGQCKLILVPDEKAEALYGPRLEKRNERLVRGGTVHFQFSRRHMRKIQRTGGSNSRKYMSSEQASELGRRAAMVRWNRVKAAAAP
jgi:hypothetical protein